MKKYKKTLLLMIVIAILVSVFAIPAYAASANVSDAVNNAFNTYIKPQIKSVVNIAVFGSVDVVLLVFFVIKLATSVVDYRQHGGQIEWKVPAGLFAGLVLSISAPFWMWAIIGW
ncbi:DUF3852 family protein [Caproiciproducens faecalis]|uniref:DUF3852 family protein n=1 Tax=Caproiciproducens faecalis TaxID=2820301 RepID=A0ABS7DPD0_9FIRM|nr:DUF3852 family protein [Caproiciproducens faecalis]MBW7573169.1 DUF3852 family protein [Caproiciproducens faecalis]